MKNLLAVVLLSSSLCTLPTLALARAAEGKAKAEACAACHGADGNSIAPMFPNLAGQSSRYIYLQLKDYKEGRRSNPLMTPQVAELTKQDMRDLGDWFAQFKQKPTNFRADPDKVARGKKVSDDALCPMCHLGGLAGQNEVPRVAGQHQEYIYAQLMAFKNKLRTNDAGNMQSVVRTLSDEDLEALSHYAASLD
jgi:cytochrome c553